MLRCPAVQVLLLDLDETLYPRGNGVLARIDARINSFMTDRLGIAEADVNAERVRLRDRFGTTMRGLSESFTLDLDDYLDHCHGVDLSDLLAPDPALRALLARIPARKAVLTNAPRAHAAQVLGLLGVAELIECVVALEDLDYEPKPAATAYETALQRLAVEPRSCLFVDDMLASVQSAVRAGMHAAWMAPPGSLGPEDGSHHVIHAVGDVEPLFSRVFTRSA